MSIETRDFVIERLEKQLIEKDREFEEIKNTLRDSILRELRRDLQNDLDLNNRIINLEQKLSELTNNVNGIMDELLDQKTVLRSANRLLGYGGDNVTAKRQVTPAVQQTSPFPKPPPASRTPVRRSPVDSAARVQPTNARFNVRDTKQEPEPVSPAPGAKSEYIIADNNDETSVRVTPQRLKNRSEYIVAEDEKTPRNRSHAPSRTSSQTKEHEDVENRDDEDVVITTSRKKPDL